MTTTALTEPPEHLRDSDQGLASVLELVPVAGPPAFTLAGFGLVLLLLLVPPITLVATVIGVVLLATAVLVAVLVLAGAILAAPVLHLRNVRARRV